MNSNILEMVIVSVLMLGAGCKSKPQSPPPPACKNSFDWSRIPAPTTGQATPQELASKFRGAILTNDFVAFMQCYYGCPKDFGDGLLMAWDNVRQELALDKLIQERFGKDALATIHYSGEWVRTPACGTDEQWKAHLSVREVDPSRAYVAMVIDSILDFLVVKDPAGHWRFDTDGMTRESIVAGEQWNARERDRRTKFIENSKAKDVDELLAEWKARKKN